MHSTEKRLRILSEDEREDLYERPHFTHEERIQYFSLSPREQALLEQLHSLTSRFYCILQLGYFKARHLFFVFRFTDVAEDTRYIQERYFPKAQLTHPSLAKGTRLKQQRLILTLYDYRSCHVEERKTLATKARQAAMVYSKPIYIFRELLHYLEEQRIVSPGYSFMQDTVGRALTYEENRLATLVRQHLEEAEIKALNRLLEDTPGLHEITQLKREPQDFRSSEIKREIHRGEQIRGVFEQRGQTWG
jgi:hypothetical protein